MQSVGGVEVPVGNGHGSKISTSGVICSSSGVIESSGILSWGGSCVAGSWGNEHVE